MTIRSNTKSPRAQAFSLVEVMAVLAILGVILSLAVPVLASVTGQGEEASATRNAQILSEMANNAIAAGNLEIPEATSVEEVIDLLIGGVRGTGTFAGTLFEVHNLSEEERVAAVPLLIWKDGVLGYRSAS